MTENVLKIKIGWHLKKIILHSSTYTQPCLYETCDYIVSILHFCWFFVQLFLIFKRRNVDSLLFSVYVSSRFLLDFIQFHLYKRQKNYFCQFEVVKIRNKNLIHFFTAGLVVSCHPKNPNFCYVALFLKACFLRSLKKWLVCSLWLHKPNVTM